MRLCGDALRLGSERGPPLLEPAGSLVKPSRRRALAGRFGTPFTVTDQPFNPAVVANPRGVWRIGNYQALAATHDSFHPLWSDTRTGQLELFMAAVRR